MTELGDTPFIWLTFGEDCKLVEGFEPLRAIGGALHANRAKDLVILSHGWKNEYRHALKLYRELWRNTLPHLPPSRPFVVAGVAWPSVRYPTDFDRQAIGQALDTRALAVPGGGGPQDLDAARFEQVVRAALPGPANLRLRRLAREAAAGPGRQTAGALVEALLARLAEAASGAGADPEILADMRVLTHAAADPMAFLDLNAQPLISHPADGQALGTGGGAALPQGIRATIARLLNQFTYYPMKARAGTVGDVLGQYLDPKEGGPQPFLQDVRLHLVGHSFGGRLVTACASRLKRLRVQSLTLLQAAFSHNGLAARTPHGAGGFANVITESRVRGPIAVTHTHNDRACTVFYALASRLSGDRTLALGDRNDPFGAMGANGAQHVNAQQHPGFPEAGRNRPLAGQVNNYRADRAMVDIRGGPDAHNNVAHAEAGRLLAAVMTA